jgi:Ca2+-binding EF-hand superfamily protein
LNTRLSVSVYEAFKAVDQNNDGRITKDELRNMIEKGGFNVNDKEIE